LFLVYLHVGAIVFVTLLFRFRFFTVETIHVILYFDDFFSVGKFRSFLCSSFLLISKAYTCGRGDVSHILVLVAG